MYDLTKMLEEIVEDEKVSKSGNRKVSQGEISRLLRERRLGGKREEDYRSLPLGEILLKEGLITSEQLEEALKLQAERGERIGSLLIQLGYIPDDALLSALSKKYDTESVSLLDLHIPEETLNLIPRSLMQKHRLLPLMADVKNVHVAMESPHDFGAIHEVEVLSGKKVHPVVTTSYQMDLATDYVLEKKAGAFDGRELQQLLKRPMTMVSLMDELHRHNGTDLLISVGSPPVIKKNGRLLPLDLPPVTRSIAEVCAKVLMTGQQVKQFQEKKQITFVSDHKATGRLRVSAYLQRGNVSLSMRRIMTGRLHMDPLGLPLWLEDVVAGHQGLVVIASPTGHGKTTTAMALVNSINERRCANIVAIHDCLEVVIPPRKSLINQRVLGVDVDSLDQETRALCTQWAEVLVLDEMKSRQAVETALASAASGCLVLGTVQAFTPSAAMEKMVDFFPASKRPDVKRSLSHCLLLVFCQRLHARGEGETSRGLSYETFSPRELDGLQDGAFSTPHNNRSVAPFDFLQDVQEQSLERQKDGNRPSNP